MDKTKTQKVKRGKVVQYNRWGYFFLIPFLVIYMIFQLIPMVSTVVNSFYENYRSGLTQVGPTYIAMDNYVKLLTKTDLMKYAGNTFIMWIMGFIPQILLALLLATWFSNMRLKLKGLRFFKTVIYLPNLIMASAFSMLFFALFSDSGPVNSILMSTGVTTEPFRFMSNIWSTRGLVSFMNFVMWFGNTTILLMAGIMGIDLSLFEAAEVDGAKNSQIFHLIILPLLKPILIFVIITSMIGGIQMFDVPQILTSGSGAPVNSTMTLIMYLNKNLYSKNFGMAGALSVILFIITCILSLIIFRLTSKKED